MTRPIFWKCERYQRAHVESNTSATFETFERKHFVEATASFNKNVKESCLFTSPAFFFSKRFQ